MLRFLAGCALAVIALLFGVFLYQNTRPLDVLDLAERVKSAEPHWANYQEDIKAQIGAKPVAQWQGKPLGAAQTGDTLEIHFEINGPWTEYALALPILIRDPFGNELRPTRAQVDGPRMTYTFNLPPHSATTPLPWIELKYPHTERRLTFSNDGSWLPTS